MTGSLTVTGAEVRGRDRRPGAFGVWYITEHFLRVMKGYGGTMLFNAVGGPLMYLFSMGIGLAILVDAGSNEAALGEVPFLIFLAPALLTSSAMMVAASELTFTVHGGFKWNKLYYSMNAAPISPAQIVMGQLLAVGLRMLVTVGIYYVILMFFGSLDWFTWTSPALILTATLTGMGIGAVTMAFAASLENDGGQLTMMQRFVITPMFLFSGTFFPLSQLPEYLQWIAWISPLWHGNELGRVISYGLEEPLWLTIVHAVYLLALLVLGVVLATRIFVRRLGR